MSARFGRLAMSACFAAVAVSSGARAQGGGETEVAAQFFEAGAAAAKKGEFRVCAEAFTEAHKRAPHGATLYNAALCWEGAKDRARAANDFAQALKLGSLSDAQAKQAKQKLAELRAALGKLEVREPKGTRASVGPIQQTPIPFETFVEPGEHEVRLEGPDGELVTRTVSVEAGQQKRVLLELGEDEPDDAPAKPTPSEPTTSDSSGDIQRTFGWVLIGASAAAAGIGVGYYVSALGAKQKFDDSDHTDVGDREDAIDRYAIARALWIGAAVGGAAGVTLVMIAPKKKPSPEPAGALRLRLHPLGASASYTF
ncbi:MAG: hypothetical protein HS104_11985 [Polyangiaceae bacterium]|nr:hypothetical protein [Polyangiaceae bacterium]MCL4756363.1 hypothetical protein [Myxococcales bacterium]